MGSATHKEKATQIASFTIYFFRYTPREKLWHVAAVARLRVFRGNNRSGSARVLVNAATQKVPFSTACGIIIRS